MIVIVDYGMGNLHSIQSKLKIIQFESTITSDASVIENASKLILPGVGHFGTGMKNINSRNLFEVLNKKVLQDKTPCLGICLGMQLMGQKSEEGNVSGLSWLNFEVCKFNFNQITEQKKLRIPHVGWNTIQIKKNNSILFKNINTEKTFYFTHSFHAKSLDESITCSTTNYGYDFISIVEKDNIYGIQFHPEKSRIYGLKMIENFLRYS